MFYLNMLKVEQEGDRLNKILKEIETKLIHIKDKPTRYFQMIRDLENKTFCDQTYFQTKEEKKTIVTSVKK